MLVVVFLGLLAVALSFPDDYTAQLFELIDVNDDGGFRLSEWFDGYNKDDLNDDGLLTFEEFAAGGHLGSPPLKVEEAFKIIDKLDGKEDGLIYPSSAFTLFKRLDANNDGKITREELKNKLTADNIISL